eukprot:2176834-Karenia_brevis.AAC.1
MAGAVIQTHCSKDFCPHDCMTRYTDQVHACKVCSAYVTHIHANCDCNHTPLTEVTAADHVGI